MQIETLNETIYKAAFDFGSLEQYQILQELQFNGYKLMGYKGASGPNQITCGLPTWFSESFTKMYGQIEIDCEPLYRVYVFEETDVRTYTTIEMQILSDEYPLGTALVLNSDGSFSVQEGSAPKGTITVLNDRPTGSKNITIGLASKILDQYAPFCAFNSIAQDTVCMRPNDKICLFIAQTNIAEGSMVKNLTGLGCTFEFNSSDVQYNLKMTRMPWGITHTDPEKSVNTKYPNQSLNQFLNIAG